jgi:hypothetical protein
MPQPRPLSAFGGSSVGLLRGGSPFSALSGAASFADGFSYGVQQMGSPMVLKPRPGSRPVKKREVLHIWHCPVYDLCGFICQGTGIPQSSHAERLININADKVADTCLNRPRDDAWEELMQVDS